MNTLLRKVQEQHIRRYNRPADVTSFAPGRIEVLGNHTDYNAGTVLSAAINFGHGFCISHSAQPGIRLHAVDVNQTAAFDTSDDQKVPGAGWADYVKGVFFLIQQRLGEKIDNFDCTFLGNIPMGAGLSSSAALEVAAATALLGLLNRELDKKEIGQLCREAEHRFAGTNCGLLDQFSSLFGREHSLIHSDFRTLEVSPVPLPADVEFLVVNPHVKHRLADSPYNERRERCEQAAAEFAALLPHPVKALRDVPPEEFAKFRSQIDPAAAKRAAHIVGEIARVQKGVALLRGGHIEAFGKLLFESHRSSVENFENSCPELDIVVEAARAAGATGARLSGGGFGGSAIVMVYEDRAKSISEKMASLCEARDLYPDFLEIIPSAGAKIAG
jgi:galactokinase